MNKPDGPIAREYQELSKQVKELLNDSGMSLHITNAGYLLQQKGIISNAKTLYSYIEDDLIRSIINARIKQKK